MHKCCAIGCRNEGVHLFPKNTEIRSQWEIALRRKNFKATKSSRLCSKHFRAEDYKKEGFFTGMKIERKVLKKGVIPSLFVWCEKESLKDEQRRKRVETGKEIRQKKIIKSVKPGDTFADIKTSCFVDDINSAVQVGVSNVALEVEVSEITIKEEEASDIAVKVEEASDIAMKVEEASDIAMKVEEASDIAMKVEEASDIAMKVEEASDLTTSSSTSHDLPVSQSTSTCEVSTQKSYQFFSVGTFMKNRKAIKFYTGIESYEKFQFVFSTLSPEVHSLRCRWSQNLHLSTEVQFFLTLIKLRRNNQDFELSLFFDISITSVSNIFVTWINFMHQIWSTLNTRPRKDLMENPSTQVIVDCTEIPEQIPTNPVTRQDLHSSYRNQSNTKFKIGATPNVLLRQCSEAYDGSTNGKQTVDRSIFLYKCEKKHTVMADCGSNDQDNFSAEGANKRKAEEKRINVSAFPKGTNQLPETTVTENTKLASKCIHGERLRGQTKSFRFLQVPIPNKYMNLMTKIYYVCHMLTIMKGIVPTDGTTRNDV